LYLSNQELPAEAQGATLGLTFHNEGNEHYNALDVHWPVGPMQHGQQLYLDQTDDDNVDIGFA